MNHNNSKLFNQSAKQIWLVSYINRSGSTFLLNELDKYKQIVSLPEGERLVKLLLKNPNKKIIHRKSFIDQLNRIIQSDVKLRLFETNLKDEDILNDHTYGDVFFRFIIKSGKCLKHDANIIVYKDTRLIYYYSRLQLFKNNFNLRLIILSRDPRAIYSSQKKTTGSWDLPMSANPVILARDWSRFEEKKRQLLSFYPTEVLDVRFEKMIGDLEFEKIRIFRYCGIEPDSLTRGSVSGYINRIPEHLRSIHGNIDKQPLPERIDKWREELNPNEKAVIRKFTGNRLKESGYGHEDEKGCDSFITIDEVCWIINYGIEIIKRWFFPNRDIPAVKK